MNVLQIKYRDIDIEIIPQIKAGKLSLEWYFFFKNERYGNALEIDSVKRDNIIGATATLIANACLTYEELCKKETLENSSKKSTKVPKKTKTTKTLKKSK